MILTLDTSVYISYILSGAREASTIHAIISLAQQGKLTIVMSDALLAEIKTAIATEKVKRYPTYSSQFISYLVAWLQYRTHRCDIAHFTPPTPPLLRDKKDNHVLALALSSYSDFLLSLDKDLLSLETVSAIRIVKPKTWLEIQNSLAL